MVEELRLETITKEPNVEFRRAMFEIEIADQQRRRAEETNMALAADMFPSMVRRSDPKWQPWVTDLGSAYDAYWTAHNRREDQAAYHEILLFGGRDGWAGDSKWRAALARWARRFACWIEQR